MAGQGSEWRARAGKGVQEAPRAGDLDFDVALCLMRLRTCDGLALALGSQVEMLQSRAGDCR